MGRKINRVKIKWSGADALICRSFLGQLEGGMGGVPRWKAETFRAEPHSLLPCAHPRAQQSRCFQCPQGLHCGQGSPLGNLKPNPNTNPSTQLGRGHRVGVGPWGLLGVAAGGAPARARASRRGAALLASWACWSPGAQPRAWGTRGLLLASGSRRTQPRGPCFLSFCAWCSGQGTLRMRSAPGQGSDAQSEWAPQNKCRPGGGRAGWRVQGMRGERGCMGTGRRDLSILPTFISFIPGFKVLGVGSSRWP